MDPESKIISLDGQHYILNDIWKTYHVSNQILMSSLEIFRPFSIAFVNNDLYFPEMYIFHGGITIVF
jgi:hypothetical protein